MILPREPELLPVGSPRREAETEVDVGALWQGVRRRLPLILLTALALALVVYLWSRSQPPVYEATASIIASSSQSQIGVVGGSVVSPLPQNTVAQVMQSPLILQPLIRAVEESQAIAPGERQQLVKQVTRDLQEGSTVAEESTQDATITVSSEQGSGENSVYTVRARAQTPGAAQVLANLASGQLLAWDAQRTLRDVRLAGQNFRLQLVQIDRRLALPGLLPLERQTLIYRRATMQDNLAQLSFLESTRTGVLKPLAAALRPVRPVAPSPLRNALLAGLLTLFLGAGVVALGVILRPSIHSEDDLLALRLPTLAILPRLRSADLELRGKSPGERGQRLAGALGFLRVGLQEALQNRAHPILLLTGTSVGEGTSTVTALLAADLAAAGQRVLLIDGDLRRGTQRSLWDWGAGGQAWRQLCGVGGGHSLHDALLDPGNVQVMEAEHGVHLLPAGSAPDDSLALLSRPDLGELLRRWSWAYDLVLIDSPPLLAMADGLVLGKHADAVVVVTEEGKTSLQAVRQAIRHADSARLPVVGFIINKAPLPSRKARTSGYGQAPRRRNLGRT